MGYSLAFISNISIFKDVREVGDVASSYPENFKKCEDGDQKCTASSG